MMPMGKPRHKWMVSCVLPSPSTVKCTKGCRRVQSHHRRVRTTNLRGILWPDWLRAVAFSEISRSQREREREIDGGKTCLAFVYSMNIQFTLDSGSFRFLPFLFVFASSSYSSASTITRILWRVTQQYV